MNFRNKTIFKFSIGQIIKPIPIAYWPTYGPEKPVIKEHEIVLNNLLNTILQIMTQEQQQNQIIEKEYLKELKIEKSRIIHNINYSRNIEWGLLEKLLNIRKQLDQSQYKFIFKKDEQITQWKEVGYLEIYGVSPYRHQNHYIHQYDHSAENERINFKVKNLDNEQQHNKNVNQITKPILDQLDREKKDKEGIINSAKNIIKKVNKIVIPNRESIDVEKDITNWKSAILQPSKSDRILVRDYELEINGLITIQNKDGLYLNENQWIKQLLYSQQILRIRTEAWMESKESLSTAKGKVQVATDFNFVMKGNPWCWVKRFDLNEEE